MSKEINDYICHNCGKRFSETIEALPILHQCPECNSSHIYMEPKRQYKVTTIANQSSVEEEE